MRRLSLLPNPQPGNCLVAAILSPFGHAITITTLEYYMQHCSIGVEFSGFWESSAYGPARRISLSLDKAKPIMAEPMPLLIWASQAASRVKQNVKYLGIQPHDTSTSTLYAVYAVNFCSKQMRALFHVCPAGAGSSKQLGTINARRTCQTNFARIKNTADIIKKSRPVVRFSTSYDLVSCIQACKKRTR